MLVHPDDVATGRDDRVMRRDHGADDRRECYWPMGPLRRAYLRRLRREKREAARGGSLAASCTPERDSKDYIR